MTRKNDPPIVTTKGDVVYREGEADGGRTPMGKDGTVLNGSVMADTAQEAAKIERDNASNN